VCSDEHSTRAESIPISWSIDSGMEGQHPYALQTTRVEQQPWVMPLHHSLEPLPAVPEAEITFPTSMGDFPSMSSMQEEFDLTLNIDSDPNIQQLDANFNASMDSFTLSVSEPEAWNSGITSNKRPRQRAVGQTCMQRPPSMCSAPKRQRHIRSNSVPLPAAFQLQVPLDSGLEEKMPSRGRHDRRKSCPELMLRPMPWSAISTSVSLNNFHDMGSESDMSQHSPPQSPVSASDMTSCSSQRSHGYGRNMYDCTLCGKQLQGKSGLRRHMRIHTGEKPFQCGQCGKSFAQKGTLTAHKRLHTGALPFECKHCGKRLRYRGSMTRHLNSYCPTLHPKC